MSTLSLVYKDKEKNSTEITTRKTYLLGVDELYVEPGYNVREIDQTHAEEFRDAFIAGEHVPPLAVQVTEKGIKVIDGHHRYFGAKMAQEAGYELRLECKDFVGSEADRIAFMVTSSQGRALQPLERAAAYQRLINQGWEPSEIAKKVKRSVTDVEQHLQLLTCGDGLIEMVKAGEVAATTAVALQREHGAKASSVAQEQMEKVKAAGKKKLTRAAAMPQFSATKARRLVELMASFYFTDDGVIADDALYLEAMGILEEYRDVHGRPQPKAEAKPVQEEITGETALPLTRDDIINQSGVEVWACASAMFGSKPEFTFNESKFAHTWAADSVERPEIVVVPTETIAKAVKLIKTRQDDEALKAWITTQYGDSDENAERFMRFVSVAIETHLDNGLSMNEFIQLLEKTDRNCWSNIRMLREAIREQFEQSVSQSAGETA